MMYRQLSREHKHHHKFLHWNQGHNPWNFDPNSNYKRESFRLELIYEMGTR